MDETERLAKAGYYAMMEVLAAPTKRTNPSAAVAPWDTLSSGNQRGMIAFARAVAEAITTDDAAWVALKKDAYRDDGGEGT